MPRLSRLVVPGYPHHITQRGVRSTDIFACDRDRLSYLKFMAEESNRFGVTFLGWCLMTNHVHLIAIPEREESLARAIGEAHRRYTRMKNFAAGVRGYLFQGRFNSCVLDQQHLLASGRYVERNPVAANIVEKAQEYPWSSCRYHCGLTEHDPLIREHKLPQMVDDWAGFLLETDEEAERNLRKKTRTGRPTGDDRFVLRLEVLAGRALRVKQPGRRLKLE
jgi:putative transposase